MADMLFQRTTMIGVPGPRAGEGPVLELLQRGPGRASGLQLPQPQGEAALGHAHQV